MNRSRECWHCGKDFYVCDGTECSEGRAAFDERNKTLREQIGRCRQFGIEILTYKPLEKLEFSAQDVRVTLESVVHFLRNFP